MQKNTRSSRKTLGVASLRLTRYTWVLRSGTRSRAFCGRWDRRGDCCKGNAHQRSSRCTRCTASCVPGSRRHPDPSAHTRSATPGPADPSTYTRSTDHLLNLPQHAHTQQRAHAAVERPQLIGPHGVTPAGPRAGVVHTFLCILDIFNMFHFSSTLFWSVLVYL